MTELKKCFALSNLLNYCLRLNLPNKQLISVSDLRDNIRTHVQIQLKKIKGICLFINYVIINYNHLV